jgi:modification methylase
MPPIPLTLVPFFQGYDFTKLNAQTASRTIIERILQFGIDKMTTEKIKKAVKTDLPVDQILQGDCIDVLNSLPEKSIDLIFADPPYNLQLQNDLYRPNMTKVDAVNDSWDKFESMNDYDKFTRKWLTACKRILKDTGTLWVIGSYHNIYRVGSILQDLGYWFLNDIVWVKANPMPNFRGVRFTNAHETLLWVQKKQGARYTFNHHAMKGLNDDLQMRSDWIIPICGGRERAKFKGEKAHSTQKPEALLYRVILSSSNPGDVILDPFFGSGTTGAVAKKLNRHWIGIERDKKYIQVAAERINAIQPDSIADTFIFENDKKKDGPRIPFGALIENGFLKAGQTIYFGAKGAIKAKILANGHIRHKNIEGSIHKVGGAIQNEPCNGWDHWYYFDEKTKEKIVIDELRKKIRASMKK